MVSWVVIPGRDGGDVSRAFHGKGFVLQGELTEYGFVPKFGSMVQLKYLKQDSIIISHLDFAGYLIELSNVTDIALVSTSSSVDIDENNK